MDAGSGTTREQAAHFLHIMCLLVIGYITWLLYDQSPLALKNYERSNSFQNPGHHQDLISSSLAYY